PGEGQEMVFAGEGIGFGGQHQRFLGKQVKAPIEEMRFDVEKAMERLDGDSALAVENTIDRGRFEGIGLEGFEDGQGKSSEVENGGLISEDAMPMELPTGFPPDARFDADMILAEAIAEAINGAAMVFCHGQRLALMAAYDRAVGKF